MTDKELLELADQALATEREGLQNQLNALTDTSKQALKRQRDALNENNRALFDQVQAAIAAKNIEQQRIRLKIGIIDKTVAQ